MWPLDGGAGSGISIPESLFGMQNCGPTQTHKTLSACHQDPWVMCVPLKIFEVLLV